MRALVFFLSVVSCTDATHSEQRWQLCLSCINWWRIKVVEGEEGAKQQIHDGFEWLSG